MNIFEELEPRIDHFKATREHVMSSARLPTSDGGLSYGNPPFAIDDGTDYYAVIDGDGNVSPLPFGYQVPNEDLEEEGVDAVFSTLMAGGCGGASVIRYISLVEDYEIPGERAFCLEEAEDSEVFGSVGRIFEGIQAMVTEKAMFNFNQRLANTIVSLYGGYEDLESIDHTMAALALQSSVIPTLVLRSYQHAIDEVQEELSDEEDE